MTKWLFFSLLILASFSNFSDAGIDSVSNSICRVGNGHGYCTGWCYKEDDEYYYFITAGHFVGGIADEMTLEVNLYHSGEMKKLEGKKVFHIFEQNTEKDLTVFKVKKESFGDYPKPEALKLGKNHDSKIIWTYGCPDGKWPTACKGRYLTENQKDEDLWDFNPPVIRGRSGSPILNEDATEVIGMVLMCNAHIDNQGIETPINGIASSIESIREILKENNLEAE